MCSWFRSEDSAARAVTAPRTSCRSLSTKCWAASRSTDRRALQTNSPSSSACDRYPLSTRLEHFNPRVNLFQTGSLSDADVSSVESLVREVITSGLTRHCEEVLLSSARNVRGLRSLEAAVSPSIPTTYNEHHILSRRTHISLAELRRARARREFRSGSQ